MFFVNIAVASVWRGMHLDFPAKVSAGSLKLAGCFLCTRKCEFASAHQLSGNRTRNHMMLWCKTDLISVSSHFNVSLPFSFF